MICGSRPFHARALYEPAAGGLKVLAEADHGGPRPGVNFAPSPHADGHDLSG